MNKKQKAPGRPFLVGGKVNRSGNQPPDFRSLGVLYARKTGHIVSVSDKARDLLQYPGDFALEDRSFLEICDSLDEVEWNHLISLLDGESAYEFDGIFLTHSGKRRLLKCVVRYETGASLLDIYFTDVAGNTDLADAALEKLRVYESFLKTDLLDINIKNTDSEYISVSGLFEKTFSLKPGEAVGKTPYDLYPPAFADHVASHDRVVLDRKQVITQIDVVPFSGKHLLVQKFPLYEKGSVSGIGVFAVDITSLKDNEKRLLESKNKYADYVELCEDILWEADHQWNLRESNLAGASSFLGIRLRVGHSVIDELRAQVRDEMALNHFIDAIEPNSVSKEHFELKNGVRIKLGIKAGKADVGTSTEHEMTDIYRGIISVVKPWHMD